MWKKTRQTSPISREKDKMMEDLVSRLPDDILVDVISRLDLDEAARTSILSSRWKHLWTLTTNLEFNPSLLGLNDYLASDAIIAKKRSKYVDWVDKVLELHRGSCVRKFEINYNLRVSHASNISNWISVAMSKKVEKFKLKVSDLGSTCTFSQECYNSLKNPFVLSNMKSLRCLHFEGVNVTKEIVEFFIHNCSLDQLVVAQSESLKTLKIVGSSIQLERLSIQICNSLEEIEISAPRLQCFEYIGEDIKIHIENAPNLVNLCIYMSDWETPIEIPNLISSIRCYFPQLKYLELEGCDEVYEQFSQFGLPNLKHLKLWVGELDPEALIGLAYIVYACPFLEKLNLELCEDSYGTIESRFLIEYPHQHLREVKVHGFRVDEGSDFQLVLFLFENTNRLEKMVVQTHLFTTEEELNMCEAQLEAVTPPYVRLIVS